MVNAFLSNDDFSQTLRVQNIILGSYHDDVSLIEVKSGNNYRRHAAIDNAYEDCSESLERRIVFCKSNINTSENGLIYMPLYMSAFI